MTLRDEAPVSPALNGGVVLMTEGAGQGPYAAAFVNPVRIVNHTPFVRQERTMVNLPNVEKICDELFMAMAETTGTTLLEMKARSGLSLRAIAKAAGYAGASSLQRYFNADYDEPLPPEVAEKLVNALSNKGNPAITPSEITGLTAYAHIAGDPILSEQAAAAFVWHVGQKLGASVARDDPEVLKLAQFLRGLLKLLAARQVSNGGDLVDGLFAGAEIQQQS